MSSQHTRRIPADPVAAAVRGVLSYMCGTGEGALKKLVLCDEQHYHIEDQDVETLKRVSPGLARLVHESEHNAATHFVCGNCGQICPIKLRKLHECRPKEQ